ncbi:hypothetical protein [Nocardioides solisilvae]|uniref:hypothetical protein n=1 Tax=Nocardioides solisilvae TaxID=1542435 RepID=UPI0013A54A75|nr:hypothetical protein [Nocardioides solisilvae]
MTRRPGPGARARTAGGVALAAVVLAGCSLLGPPDPDSPEGRVEVLVEALVAADRDALLEVLDDERFSTSTALLTDEVLAQGVFAGREVDVETTNRHLGAREFALRLEEQDEDERPWLEPGFTSSGDPVGLVLPTVTLQGRGVHALRVGDQTIEVGPLPPEGTSFYLPPGEVELAAVGGERYVEREPPERIDTRELLGRRERDLGGRLTPEARAVVRKEVAEHLDRCTGTFRRDRPSACPLRKAWIGGLAEETWTVDGVPRVDIRAGLDAWYFSTRGRLRATMRGTYVPLGGGPAVPAADAFPVRIDGTVEVRGGRLVVRVQG